MPNKGCFVLGPCCFTPGSPRYKGIHITQVAATLRDDENFTIRVVAMYPRSETFLLSCLIVDWTYDLFYGLLKSSSNGNFLSVDGDFLACRHTATAEPEFVKRLRVSGIDSRESISPAYVAWRAGTSNRVVVPVCQAGDRLLGSLKSLEIQALGSETSREVAVLMFRCL